MANSKILYDGPDAVWLVNNLSFPFADHQGNTFLPGMPTKAQKTSWTDAQVKNAVLSVYTVPGPTEAAAAKPVVPAPGKVSAPKPADPAKAAA